MTKYVAYTNLGPGRESGTFVNPDDFGGEDNETFQDMLRARTIVPLGDPDASIAMGQAPDEGPDEREEELQAAKDRVAELERLLAEARKPQESDPSSSGSGTSGGSSPQGGSSGGSSSSQSGSASTKSATPGQTK